MLNKVLNWALRTLPMRFQIVVGNRYKAVISPDGSNSQSRALGMPPNKKTERTTVLLDTASADMLRSAAPPHNENGIIPFGTVYGPITNGAIYRRHGLFRYHLEITSEQKAELLRCAPPDKIEEHWNEELILSYRLASILKPSESWHSLIQLLGYAAERARANRTKYKALTDRLAEVKRAHEGDFVIQVRNALGKTVH